MLLTKDRKKHQIGIIKFLFSCIYPNNFNVVILIRIYHFLERHNLPTFLIHRLLYHIHGLEFAKNCQIGEGISFPHPRGILFTEGTRIEENCVINGNVRFIGRHGSAPTVRENVFIGDSAIILGGVTLERETVVGAGSVVTKSFQKKVSIAGNPAKIIKHSTKR